MSFSGRTKDDKRQHIIPSKNAGVTICEKKTHITQIQNRTKIRLPHHACGFNFNMD